MRFTYLIVVTLISTNRRKSIEKRVLNSYLPTFVTHTYIIHPYTHRERNA